MPLSKTTKVILDTNVFLSGLLFGGKPEQILTWWSKGAFVLCISPVLHAEIITKLTYKFHADTAYIQSIEQMLTFHTDKYVPQVTVRLCKDATDNFLLELAEVSRAAYLVSGDKAVIAFKQYKKTTIISPKAFLDLIS